MPAPTNDLDAFIRDFGKWFHADRDIDVLGDMRCRLSCMLNDAANKGIEVGRMKSERAARVKVSKQDQKRLERMARANWGDSALAVEAAELLKAIEERTAKR